MIAMFEVCSVCDPGEDIPLHESQGRPVAVSSYIEPTSVPLYGTLPDNNRERRSDVAEGLRQDEASRGWGLVLAKTVPQFGKGLERELTTTEYGPMGSTNTRKTGGPSPRAGCSGAGLVGLGSSCRPRSGTRYHPRRAENYWRCRSVLGRPSRTGRRHSGCRSDSPRGLCSGGL